MEQDRNKPVDFLARFERIAAAYPPADTRRAAAFLFADAEILKLLSASRLVMDRALGEETGATLNRYTASASPRRHHDQHAAGGGSKRISAFR
jgi:hypothetical protein